MISHIDHLVITVRSIEVTCTFYERVLGFTRKVDPDRPTALHFGSCKINVHAHDRTFEPKAVHPTLGAGDFCLIASVGLDEVIARLEREGVPIEAGPVAREGASGAMTSIYFRDPDGNLIEVSRYDVAAT